MPNHTHNNETGKYCEPRQPPPRKRVVAHGTPPPRARLAWHKRQCGHPLLFELKLYAQWDRRLLGHSQIRVTPTTTTPSLSAIATDLNLPFHHQRTFTLAPVRRWRCKGGTLFVGMRG